MFIRGILFTVKYLHAELKLVDIELSWAEFARFNLSRTTGACRSHNKCQGNNESYNCTVKSRKLTKWMKATGDIYKTTHGTGISVDVSVANSCL